MKIKILHIIKSLGRGGAETLLPETLKMHNREDFEFHYIYFLPWKNQMVEAIEQAGGKVACLSASNNLKILLQYQYIINYIKKDKIDLIHCHLPWAGFLCRIVHKLNGIPVIYSEHNLQNRYHWMTRWLNKVSYNWQNQAIAVSRDVADSIVKSIKPHIPVTTILNGVNTGNFRRNHTSGMNIRKELNIPESGLVVGTIAVFRTQKRLEEWLQVFAEAWVKNNHLYGIIVGDGPLKKKITTKWNELNLEGKVFFAGLQTDVKPWLSAMDIYLMTSVFEGLPIALLEAMSMQCAIVCTDAGGIKEVIRNEIDGLLVPVSEWQKLPLILEQYKSKDYREKMGYNAQSRIEEEFSIKKMVFLLEDLYKEIYQKK